MVCVTKIRIQVNEEKLPWDRKGTNQERKLTEGWQGQVSSLLAWPCNRQRAESTKVVKVSRSCLIRQYSINYLLGRPISRYICMHEILKQYRGFKIFVYQVHKTIRQTVLCEYNLKEWWPKWCNIWWAEVQCGFRRAINIRVDLELRLICLSFPWKFLLCILQRSYFVTDC